MTLPSLLSSVPSTRRVSDVSLVATAARVQAQNILATRPTHSITTQQSADSRCKSKQAARDLILQDLAKIKMSCKSMRFRDSTSLESSSTSAFSEAKADNNVEFKQQQVHNLPQPHLSSKLELEKNMEPWLSARAAWLRRWLRSARASPQPSLSRRTTQQWYLSSKAEAQLYSLAMQINREVSPANLSPISHAWLSRASPRDATSHPSWSRLLPCDPDACPICHESLIKDVLLASCSHAAHQTCLQRFNAKTGSRLCPVCRTEVGFPSLSPFIFLLA